MPISIRIPVSRPDLANLSRPIFASAAALSLLSAPAQAQTSFQSLSQRSGQPAAAQDGAQTAAQNSAQMPAALTYVDLLELALASDVVARIQVRKQTTLRPERAPDVAPDQRRVYVEADTQALLGGTAPIGEALTFLVDLPATDRGRAPKIKKLIYLVFAQSVPGRPGEIRLSGPSAMQPVSPELEQRIRLVLGQLAQADRPPVITGIREAMSVPGNLAGESETQVFLSTRDGAPVSLSIVRRPGMEPVWGVSWTDIVDQSARPPLPETLQWYALACFLPSDLPDEAYIQRDRESRDRARADYRLVRDQIGTCARSS